MFSGNATRGILMAEMQEVGVRVFMEVDDNYLVAAPFSNNDWEIRIDRSPADAHSSEAHRQIVPWCDGVIVSTEQTAPSTTNG